MFKTGKQECDIPKKLKSENKHFSLIYKVNYFKLLNEAFLFIFHKQFKNQS